MTRPIASAAACAPMVSAPGVAAKDDAPELMKSDASLASVALVVGTKGQVSVEDLP